MAGGDIAREAGACRERTRRAPPRGERQRPSAASRTRSRLWPHQLHRLPATLKHAHRIALQALGEASEVVTGARKVAHERRHPPLLTYALADLVEEGAHVA